MRNGKKVDEHGNIYYFMDDMLHREDGPAVEHVSGTKIWWIRGKIHNIHGPAIIYPDGQTRFYINDELVSERQFIEQKLTNFLK